MHLLNHELGKDEVKKKPVNGHRQRLQRGHEPKVLDATSKMRRGRILTISQNDNRLLVKLGCYLNNAILKSCFTE